MEPHSAPQQNQQDASQTEVSAQPAVIPPKKKGLSTGALVAIILGSFFGLLFLVGLAIVSFLVFRAGFGELTPNDAPYSLNSEQNGAAEAFKSLATYEGAAFTFEYPDAWQQKDTSNVTNIIGGVVPDAYVIILAEPKSSPVIVNYTYNKGSEQLVDKEKARSAMKTALQAQITTTERQLITMREATGHGCAANAAYTDEPAYQEKGDLIGYTYGYTCTSYDGPVQGLYGVWYDAYGGQHRLLVSSLQDYWDENEVGLEAILESAKALSHLKTV